MRDDVAVKTNIDQPVTEKNTLRSKRHTPPKHTRRGRNMHHTKAPHRAIFLPGMCLEAAVASHSAKTHRRSDKTKGVVSATVPPTTCLLRTVGKQARCYTLEPGGPTCPPSPAPLTTQSAYSQQKPLSSPQQGRFDIPRFQPSVSKKAVQVLRTTHRNTRSHARPGR